MNQFQAGDVLVGCTNVNGVPPGYMGHSAIVVDPYHIVEAVNTMPQVRKSPIGIFQTNHPIYVHFRPKSPQMAQSAVQCALHYLHRYQDNLRQGYPVPFFSFQTEVPLHDPWGNIYCSKLVWLSFYYCANYMLPNDFGLFTPEDLSTVLSSDPNFLVLFRHPDFQFLIDS